MHLNYRNFRTLALKVLICVQIFTYSAHPNGNDSTNSTYGSGRNFLIDFYQKYISPVRGDNTCPMYPSCSQYAKLAFKNQSPVFAYVNTCSRLLACGQDDHTYPTVIVDGTLKLYDPAPEKKVALEYNSSSINELDSQPDPKSIPENVPQFFKHYADYCLQNGSYLRAYEYYSLCLHSITDDSLRQEVLLSLITASYKAHSPGDFNQVFYDHAEMMDSNSRSSCGLYLTKSHFVSGKYSEVINEVKRYRSKTDENRENYEYRILQGLSYCGNYEFVNAQQAFDSAAVFGKGISSVELNETIERLRHTKHPATAGLSSAILPGSGFLYAKRPSTALVAFIVNGLFVWSAAEMFMDKKYGLGTTISFLGVGWYVGSIRGSIKAVHDYNYSLRQAVLMDLAKKAEISF